MFYIEIIHHTLLVGLLSLSIFYALIMLKTRWAMRRVLLAWYTPIRFPISKTLMVAFILSFSLWLFVSIQKQDFVLWEIVAYFVMSKCFLMAGMLSTTTIITEYGILQRTEVCYERLAFGQIEDYFVHIESKYSIYIFFYHDAKRQRRRFELIVPLRYESKMREIIAAKLDARFEFNVFHSYGTKTLND